MPEADLHSEFAKRGPWVTRYWLGGRPYGGEFDAMSDPRLDQFWNAFPRARTILELGSLEGGHTFGLAARPAVKRVVGVEGRQANVARAAWIGTLLGTSKVEFVQANLETTPLSTYGTFDAVFCCGLLYHLPRPGELIDSISQVTTSLFLSTHYAPEDQADAECDGVPGIHYHEFGLDDPLSGLSSSSFWPTLDGLLAIVRARGFGETRIVDHNRHNPNGPTVSLAASQSAAVARGRATQPLRHVLRRLVGR